MRVFIRAIGLVSVVILARILVPADFGLVALATMVLGFIEMMGAFSFSVALIQKQQAGRDYYDTVWTLGIIRGVLTCGLLFGIAAPATEFFGDPRLLEIIYVLALVALVRSVGNVGVIDFQKHLEFDKDFKFEAGVKLASFCVTMVAAFLLRSYWALVIGIASGGIVRVGLSYAMHHYRPRLSLACWREIMHFSKWLLVNNFISFLSMRSYSLIVGKFLGAASLGIYTIANEIASLASTELIMPIRRALLPGYAKFSNDLELLRSNYIDGFGLILMLGTPAAAGLGLIADPMVRLFLGDKWLAAIPLLQVLAVSGVLQVTMGNIGPVILALGRPSLITIISIINLTVGIPLFIWATLEWGINGTVWALVVSTFVTAAASFVLSIKILNLSVRKLVSTVWRTPVSLFAMIVTVGSIERLWVSNETIAGLAFQLILEMLLGIGVYVALHLSLWRMAGSPRTAERHALNFLIDRFKQIRNFTIRRS